MVQERLYREDTAKYTVMDLKIIEEQNGRREEGKYNCLVHKYQIWRRRLALLGKLGRASVANFFFPIV